MRRLWVAALPAGEVALDGPAAHKVRHVLRLRAGAALVLFDGAGGEVDAELLAAGPEGCRVAPTGAPRTARPRAELHLLFGVPKGAPLDNLLRMAVEVGATHLHPLVTQRTVPKGDHGDRWGRIAVSAAAQCGRADVPVIAPLRTLREALAALPEGLDRRVGVPGAEDGAPCALPGALCVGPEGGLTDAEVDLLLASGFRALAWSPWVLRVDTAAVVGLSLFR